MRPKCVEQITRAEETPSFRFGRKASTTFLCQLRPAARYRGKVRKWNVYINKEVLLAAAGALRRERPSQ